MLDDNQLTSLPGEIGELYNLEELHLGNNQLESLPDEIGQLTNLIQVKLHGNRLARLPTSFAGLNKIRNLELNPASIQAAHPSVIAVLARLGYRTDHIRPSDVYDV